MVGVANAVMTLEGPRLRERYLADIAVEWSIASVTSLMHNKVGALVKDLVVAPRMDTDVECALPPCYLVAGYYTLAVLGIGLFSSLVVFIFIFVILTFLFDTILFFFII